MSLFTESVYKNLDDFFKLDPKERSFNYLKDRDMGLGQMRSMDVIQGELDVLEEYFVYVARELNKTGNPMGNKIPNFETVYIPNCKRQAEVLMERAVLKYFQESDRSENGYLDVK